MQVLHNGRHFTTGECIHEPKPLDPRQRLHPERPPRAVAQKGAVWINGFNLGRFWDIGPQRRLYLPAPLLRKGRNELLVLELHDAPAERTVELVAEPDLGRTA